MCFASHIFIDVQKWTSVKLDLFHSLPSTWLKSPPQSRNVANIYGQRSWFGKKFVCLTNSLTSGGVFNSTLLEVNKIQQSFNLGRHSTLYAMGVKLFTRSLKNSKVQRYKRRSFLINFLPIFYQTIKFAIDCAIKMGKPFES